MTPKEKAEELIKMFNKVKIFIDIEPSNIEIAIEDVDCDANKHCALIAVDEIIQSRQDDGHFNDTLSSTGSEYYTPHPMYLTYWLQVKNEINKL
jgi:hypothetical protein